MKYRLEMIFGKFIMMLFHGYFHMVLFMVRCLNGNIGKHNGNWTDFRKDYEIVCFGDLPNYYSRARDVRLMHMLMRPWMLPIRYTKSQNIQNETSVSKVYYPID